jgi:hypothetical protein
MPSWKKIITSGSVAILSNVTASSYTGSFTGSLNGTSSWAVSSSRAISSSFSLTAISASFAISSSRSVSSSFSNTAISASFATTASFALNAGGGVTINNNTDNFIVTATGTANTVNGEANLTFDGSKLTVVGDTDITGTDTSNGTSGLIVKDSNSTTTFDVRNDGEIKINTARYNANGVLTNSGGNVTEVAGFNGTFTVPTNPPGQQTLVITNGIITAVL